MATVIGDLQKDRLKSEKMAFSIQVISGPIVSPRFFCCTAGNVVGVAKEPVAVMNVPSGAICVNDSISYDGSASFDPDGAITAYLWNFGDGSTSNAASGTHQYTAAGLYTVTLTVTDGTGLHGSAYMRVSVINCPSDTLAGEFFIGHTTAGPYYYAYDASGTRTGGQRATGLVGNWLNIRDIKLDPHRKYGPVGTRHVWIATQAGVAHSENDMIAWTLHNSMPTPRNDAYDAPAPVVADLDWYCVSFSPYKNEVYILVGTATRSWIYWSMDDGITWDNWQVNY